MVTQLQGLDMEALEGMVDRHGVAGVLHMLAEVCSEKATHLESNWQDRTTAKLWDTVGNRATKLANTVGI